MFESITVRKMARGRFERKVDFRSSFSFDVTGDAIYTTIVIVDTRRYLVAGTYDTNLPEHNMSLASVGCNDAYKGDIAVCFFDLRQRERFLQRIPFFGNLRKKNDALCRVLAAFVKFS